MADGCANYHRSTHLHAVAAGAAEPGRGLPGVEPGMPLPAGTGMQRRQFLLRAAGLALAVYGGGRLSGELIEEGIAHAAVPEAPILVSVFLDGGADSLSLLAPVGDPRYRTLRPKLALEPHLGRPFAQDERLRWHPSADGLATLHEEGKVTTFPAIGYTSPNASHFTSRHFWQVGEVSTDADLGWLGRYLDLAGAPDNPLQGLSLASALFPSLATARMPVAAVTAPSSYTFTAPGVSGPLVAPMHAALGELGGASADSPALARARTAARDSARLRTQLAPFSTVPAGAGYPTGSAFPQRLAGLAAMVAENLPLRCVTLNAAGGYDTHASQATAFPANLKLTCDSLLAFQRDLEQRGVADRVLVQLWSEFGRRPGENGSAGTDHGAGGAAFLIGTRASGAMVGEFPGLARLDPQGNLRSTSDFRGFYAGLLEQWFGFDAAAVIPGAAGFERPVLVA